MSRERYVILPDTKSPEFLFRVKEAIEVLMGTHFNTSEGRRAPTLNEVNEVVDNFPDHVTFENLNANGDIGTGSDQVAQGDRGVTNGDSHDHSGGDGAQIDHGGLGGLSDDDHTQYLKEKASGGAASEVPAHTHADDNNAGTVDHGALTGLTDNDHPHYEAQAYFLGASL